VAAPADRARTSLRFDWVLAVLSVWLIGGFYIDLWAHAHGRVDDTFFTPWHAILYAGAASFAVVLAGLAIFGSPRGVPVRDALPGPYRLSLVGVLLFGVGGVLDLAWHTAFGFEVDVEALLSPTHLLLATSGLLMLSGPIRSAAARLWMEPERHDWLVAGPFVIALTMASAVLIAFTQYVNPIVDAWASATETAAGEPPAQVYAMSPTGGGQRRLTVVDGEARGARLSPDGQSFVYSMTTGRDDPDQVHVSATDGSGDRAITTEGSNFRPAWSPDGSLIAFSSTRDGEPDVYVMRADGSDVRRITDDPASDWAPAWSPDGAAIAFNSNRSGTFDIYRIGPDRGATTAVTGGPDDDFEPDWSPDGSQIAFTSNRGGDFAIWLVSAEGGEPTRLDTGDGNAYMPSWSPDGERIAFASSRTGDFEVYVVPANGGEPTNISRNPGVDDGWVAPAWSPDGSLILYPSEASAPFWRVPYVRQGFGAAGILVAAGLLAGCVAFARRRGALPFGAYLLVVGVPASMATLLSDEYRFIPAALVAGLAADVAARAWPRGRSRLGDAAFAFVVPALFFAAYFVAISATTGIGWSIHLWLGAILIAGAIGLFVDELTHGPARDTAPAARSEGPPA
jgi:TolB protein